MMEMIKIENGTAVLDPQVISSIAEYERAIKAIEDKENEIREQIMKEMKKNNLIKIDMDEIMITYVAPTTKESFDSKAFRKAEPKMYDEFVKITSVKESIRIKLK